MGNLTTKTSGEIASFMSPSITNIKSLKVHFSPKQLGTGDPSPENVREIVGWDGVEVKGCGKNLASVQYGYDSYGGDPTSTVIQYRSESINEYVSSLINIEPNTTYTISREFIGGIFRYYFYSEYPILDITYSIGGSSGNANKYSFTFTTPSNAKYLFVVWTRTNSTRPCGKVQIELGSTATLYKPYQSNNISCQWTKNIKQWTYIDTTIDDSYPSNNFNGYANGRWDYAIENIPNEWFGKELTYSAYIKRSSSPFNDYDDVRVWCYGDSTTLFDAKTAQRIYTAEESGRSWVTFTIPEGTTKIAFGLMLTKGSRAYNPQLEYGSEPTEYQPYVGTVYGGYVDLISGELVEEYYSVIENGQKSWSFNNNYNDNYYRSFITPSALEVPNPIINNNKQFYNICLNGSYTTKFNGWIGSTGNFLFYLPQSLGITTKDEWTNFLSINPLQICYPLAEPITHQLTPTQLKSFVGQNNFWSNADYIEIEYDLIETIDIQKCRKKIILNQPHIIESIKNDLISFTTDMKAPLKECKVYFKPMQEGSGDPSPTNVRNINGWTGLDNYVNGDKISVDWTDEVGTVYGGYLDLAKGEVVAEYESVSAPWSEWTFGENLGNNTRKVYSTTHKSIGGNAQDTSLCNLTNNYLWNNNNDIPHFYVANNGNSLYAILPNILDENQQVQIIYKLAEPIHYPLTSLTSQQLLTIKGWNNYWSNVDTNLEIKYWTHKLSPSESNIAYVGENLTFDGTVNSVIDTGVYLFNEENINRDFEVTIEGLYGNTNNHGNIGTNSANTIICAKHNGNAYGFLVRANSGINATYNGTISVKMDYNNSLVIKRVNGVISATGDLITNPKVKFTNTVHQWPLVLGCAIDDDGTYYRYATGSIKRIIVRWL